MIDYSLMMENLHTGFVDLIIAGVGLAVTAFGSAKGAKDAKKANRKQDRINKASNAVQNQIADTQLAASEQIAALTRQQENIRKQVMLNEAARQTREVARQTQIARSLAVSGASNSGGLFSSGLQGAVGSILQQGDAQATNIFENRRFGLQNFALNKSITDIQTGTNRTLTGLNKQLTALGVSSQNNQNQAQANANLNNSLFATGVNIANSATTASNVFTSLFGQPKVS